MPSKVKIYTRRGDHGETSLYGGRRIPKSHIRIKSYGSIDELNSFLGIVLTKLNNKRIRNFINQIQKDLFTIGSNLAGANISLDCLKISVENMEKLIDQLDKQLPELKNFILPEGTEKATLLYYVRAITRRVEREVVDLSQKETIDEKIIVYLNRLSDLLFILGRYVNFQSGVTETIWKNR